MHKQAVLIAALLSLTAGPALAAQPGADWLAMDQVVRKLGEAGYSSVSSLEAEDGRWQGRAVKDGRSVAFAVDPHSGAVVEKGETDKNGRKDEDGDD